MDWTSAYTNSAVFQPFIRGPLRLRRDRTSMLLLRQLTGRETLIGHGKGLARPATCILCGFRAIGTTRQRSKRLDAHLLGHVAAVLEAHADKLDALEALAALLGLQVDFIEACLEVLDLKRDTEAWHRFWGRRVG